jgi:MFS family permease
LRANEIAEATASRGEDANVRMTPHRSPGWLTGIALLLPITLTTMAVVLLAPVVPQLMQEFAGVSGHEYWVPMILTVPSLCVALLCPFSGMLGDYFGRRKLLMAALVAYAIVGVAPAFLHGLPQILLSRVGVGVAESLIYVLSTTMIGDYYSGAARDKWLAGQTAFASVSALMFLNIGGMLGETGWRAPFWVYSSALVMCALVLAFTWEPAADDASDEAIRAPHNTSWAGFPWKIMWMIVGTTIYGSIFFYTVQIQASSGLASLGLKSPAQIGFLTSIASIGVPLGTLLYSRIGGAQVARLLLAEFALLALGFLLMGHSGSVEGFLAGCFINQLGAGMLLPTLLVWSMSVLRFEFRGRGTGFWQSAFALGQFLSPIVVTVSGNVTGGIMGAFTVLSAAAAVGAIIVMATQMLRGKPA